MPLRGERDGNMHRRGRFTGAAFFIGEHDIMCLSVRHGPGCSPDAIRDLDPVPPSLHSNLGQAMTALIGAFINVQIIRELTLLREAIAALRGSGTAGTRKTGRASCRERVCQAV